MLEVHDVVSALEHHGRECLGVLDLGELGYDQQLLEALDPEAAGNHRWCTWTEPVQWPHGSRPDCLPRDLAGYVRLLKQLADENLLGGRAGGGGDGGRDGGATVAAAVAGTGTGGTFCLSEFHF